MTEERLVYFVGARSVDLVKIGVVTLAAGDFRRVYAPERLQSRAKRLGKELGAAVEIEATTPGYVVVERWFHRRHAAARHHREWFRRTPALVADMATLATGRRVEGQPVEWEPEDGWDWAWFDGVLLQHYRTKLFKLSLPDMARLMGAKPINWRQRENTRQSAVIAADIALAAQSLGLDLTVERIRADAALLRGPRERAA